MTSVCEDGAELLHDLLLAEGLRDSELLHEQVPRGVEHRTAADQEAEVILLEPAGILNTGNIVDEKYTAPTGVRI